MMKYVFALAALLHLCYSAGNSLDFNLNREILKKLDELNKLCRDKKLNLTSPARVPTTIMHHNASVCVDVFTRELKNLLNHVRVPEDREHLLEELKANLQSLRSHHQQIDYKCKMEQTRSLTPFKAYSTFIKKLNLRKR